VRSHRHLLLSSSFIIFIAIIRAVAADLTATPRNSDAQRALHRATRLLCGEADALAELNDALSLAWYDVLAATLTYLNPTAQSYDVPYVAPPPPQLAAFC